MFSTNIVLIGEEITPAKQKDQGHAWYRDRKLYNDVKYRQKMANSLLIKVHDKAKHAYYV